MKTLDDLGKQGNALLGRSSAFDAHLASDRVVKQVADWLSGIAPGSGLLAEWVSLSQSMLVVGNQWHDSPAYWMLFQKAVRERLQWLGALGRAFSSRAGAEDSKRPVMPPSGKVFVVHGRNEVTRERVARYLEKLGLEPVILHEKPNAGRTIIEEFIDYSDASFAVILLTGDDVGRLASDPGDREKPRARQNVIMELGFFLGKLGRKNVCALYEPGVGIPSDYQGVLFVELDEHNGWKPLLARELKAAGIPFDENRMVNTE